MKKIGFIGAGKVGTTLGKYFLQQGVQLSGFYSRSASSAREAAKFTQSNAYGTLDELVTCSDWIFITTADSAIEQVWKNLSGLNIDGKAVCHCSGAFSSSVFAGIESTGASGYSVHPMHAFADKHSSYQRLSSSSVSIEGDGIHKESLINLFTKAGNTVLLVKTDKKALYHAANVAASNLVLSLLSKSVTLLVSSGVDREHALNALMPLVRNNIENIASLGFSDALTGPVERNDTTTIQKHLAVLPKEEICLYQALSKELLGIAEKKHPDQDYTEMRNVFNFTD